MRRISMRPISTRRISVAVGPTGTGRTLSARAARLAAPALVVGAAVLLAACGSSDSNTSGSSKSTSTTITTTMTGPKSTSAVVVKSASVGDLGTILVDADGKTLYTLTSASGAVACTGGCLTAWPPLLLPAGTTKATGASGVQLGTTTQGSDQQVTHDNLPLYRFAADTASGDANGEGISSFGGTWHVVKISGDTGSGGGAGTSSTTKSSGSGY